MKITFTGEIIEVGQEPDGKHGMTIKTRAAGQQLLLFIVDQPQAQAFARHLFESVQITVETEVT